MFIMRISISISIIDVISIVSINSIAINYSAAGAPRRRGHAPRAARRAAAGDPNGQPAKEEYTQITITCLLKRKEKKQRKKYKENNTNK